MYSRYVNLRCFINIVTKSSALIGFDQQSLDTYQALAAANILPSTEQTYTSQEIEDALTSVTGCEVVLGCHGNRLDEAVSFSFPFLNSFQKAKLQRELKSSKY